MTQTASTSTVSRAAAIAAGTYFVLLFTTPPDGPAVETASSDQIRAYYAANASALHVSALASAIAAPAIIVFCACVAHLVSRRLGPSVWPALILAGGVLIGVWHWLTAAVEANTAVQALDGTSLSTVNDSVLTSWYAMTNISHLFGDLAMSAIALTLASVSLGALHAAVLPRWLCWLGVVISAAGFIGLCGLALAVGPLANVWFIGLFGWALWLPTAAACLLVRVRRVEAEPPVVMTEADRSS